MEKAQFEFFEKIVNRSDFFPKQLFVNKINFDKKESFIQNEQLFLNQFRYSVMLQMRFRYTAMVVVMVVVYC